MHEIAVSHHLAALSAGPGRVRQDLRHEVNRLGGQQQHHPKAPPKRDPRFRLSSRGDGAGLTMRPSRRPTVTRNGRASIVAWFPQTPQPDAHHIHYRIRRFWEVMIVTRLGPGRCRAHPSARLSLACSPSHHQVQLQFFPPVPASAPILERLFPATRLLFLAAMHAPRCPSPVPLETGLFFDEPRAEVFTCIRVQLASGGASGKTWPWVTATTSSARLCRLCRRPNARVKLAEVSFALLDVIIGRWGANGCQSCSFVER